MAVITVNEHWVVTRDTIYPLSLRKFTAPCFVIPITALYPSFLFYSRDILLNCRNKFLFRLYIFQINACQLVTSAQKMSMIIDKPRQQHFASRVNYFRAAAAVIL